MKVLFAVSSESISDAIIKRYQKEYKEILSYKNVYYFNAILKEIQKDKSYDRIVISEDLEPFSNNNYDTIDKFIFEKLDNISDEANDGQGKESTIILICTDRHTKGSSFLVKLFGIGVYNALLGNDRSMDQVCKLINKPRLKKEAKMYYKIDAEDVSYDSKSEKEVSELEIQNILNHFKKISKNKEKFADSFNNIAGQYTDEQLKIIINCLPISVKAVLEEECPKYQELMSVGGMIQKVGGNSSAQTKEVAAKAGIKIDILESKLSQPKMSGPIVIPSSVRTSGSRGPVKVTRVESPSAQAEQPTKKVVKKVVSKPKEEDTLDSLLSGVDGLEEKNDVKPNKPKDLKSVFDEEDEDDTLLVNSPNKQSDELLSSVEDDDLNLDFDSDVKSDDLTLDFDDEMDDDDLTLGLDDEPADDDLTLGLDDDTADDDLTLSLDDTADDDLMLGLDDDTADDDLMLGLDDDTADDDLMLGLDDDTADDDLMLGLDDDTADDDLTLGLDDDTADDDLMLGLDDDTSDDDLLVGIDDEEDSLPSLESDEEPVSENKTITIKRGRGRPRKTPVDLTPKPKGKRGRPRKTPLEEVLEEDDDALDLVLDEEAVEAKESKITPDMFLNQDDSDLTLPSDEELDDDTLEIVDEEVDDDDLLVGLDDESEDDDLTLDFDDNVENDDLEIGLDDDLTDDDLSLDLEDTDDDSFEIVDDDEYEVVEEDDNLEIVDDEFSDEVDIPDIDDLDDLEDVEVSDDIDLADTDDDSFEVVDDDEYEVVEEDDFSDEMSLPNVDGLDDVEDFEDDSSQEFEYEEVEDDDFLSDNTSTTKTESAEEDDDDLFLNFEDDDFSSTSGSANTMSNSFEDNLEDEPILNQSYNNYSNANNSVESIKPQIDYSMSNLNSLLTKDKKIVTFIGTTKNGTSFLINNLAALFSSLGINTAVLDMTQNRNSYYIYTKNEEELRKIAYTSIEKLENGFAEGIRVDKNLTVYTALPNNGKKYTNAEPILSTLVQNHSLVLIDCDFDTDPAYFASCQEIYLVQSMDILTIQPLTSFLRDLKAKGVLESEKVRVVINKEIKVRSLTSKVIIGGMSFYNDPAMSFMTELFNKDMVKCCTIPFEDAAYSKYLDAMVNCSLSLNGYSKAFLSKLRILGDMVYPLTSKQTYSNPTQNYKKNAFSNSMNNTLNQMKNKF